MVNDITAVELNLKCSCYGGRLGEWNTGSGTANMNSLLNWSTRLIDLNGAGAEVVI